jgi:hypothetical protein
VDDPPPPPPPVALNVPLLSDRPVPMLISSATPVLAVLRPRRRLVAMLVPIV